MRTSQELRTYYIRHSKQLDVDRATSDKLKSKDIIALRFPRDKNGKLLAEDNDSDDPQAYHGNDKIAIRTFNELAQHGGYVCAEYEGFDGCVVGVVEANTTIEKIHGYWAEDGEAPGRKAVHVGNVPMTAGLGLRLRAGT